MRCVEEGLGLMLESRAIHKGNRSSMQAQRLEQSLEQSLDLDTKTAGSLYLQEVRAGLEEEDGGGALGPEASWITRPAKRPRWLPGEDTPRPRSCLVETLSLGRVAKRVSEANLHAVRRPSSPAGKDTIRFLSFSRRRPPPCMDVCFTRPTHGDYITTN